MTGRIAPSIPRRPRLVLAYADSAYASLCARHFRRLGWEVHLASSGPDARRLVACSEPHVVVLDTQLPEESGWLTCAKLTVGAAPLRVIMVASELTENNLQKARDAGAAAIVAKTNGVETLASEILTRALQQAG
jgi:DNA-binding response OmpR family regulator